MVQNSEQTSDNISDFFKVPVGIHWVSSDGTILKATQNELQMLGYSPDELVGQHIADIHVDKEEIEHILRKSKVGVELQDYETQLHCKDGSVRRVILNSDTQREGGKLDHIRFFVRDVSERRLGELSNALLAAIIVDSNDAIISKDLDGTITSWNNSAERIFGYSASEVIGKSITTIIPEERLEEEIEILNRLRRGDRVDHFETIREHKDGTRLNISLNISPIKDSEGTIVGASKIARDITKRKQAEASLISYQEQLRSLISKLSKAEEQERQRLANVLHDNLGQLLTMSKMKLDQMSQEMYSENLVPEINELKGLVSEANSFTRELMSELKPPAAFDQEHFETAVEMVADKMEKHNLDVTIEDDEKPKPLNDEVQTVLLQSIRELLFNVVKHANVNKAKVVLRRNDTKVQIKVIDDGTGFDVNDEELVSSEEGGFGLFSIEERMGLLGGKLEIHSEPGKGTKVELVAPLKDNEKSPSIVTDEEQKEEVFATPTETMTEKITILIADDHQIMREGIRNLIEGETDMTVVAEASSGKEAVELTEKTSPDVVIMDINMPGMNGIEATKEIFSTGDSTQPIVIGLSIHNNDDVEQSMKKAGAVAYLPKTEAFEFLCATIRSEVRAREM